MKKNFQLHQEDFQERWRRFSEKTLLNSKQREAVKVVCGKLLGKAAAAAQWSENWNKNNWLSPTQDFSRQGPGRRFSACHKQVPRKHPPKLLRAEIGFKIIIHGKSILVRLGYRKNELLLYSKIDRCVPTVLWYWGTGGKERVQFCRIAHRSHPEVSGYLKVKGVFG